MRTVPSGLESDPDSSPAADQTKEPDRKLPATPGSAPAPGSVPAVDLADDPTRGRESVPGTDLTASARIRNAAISRFAQDGFDVGLRAIAADAGVTAGLITHHFGSKAGLRTACDAEVLRLIASAKCESAVLGGPIDLFAQMPRIDDYIPATAYVLRSITEGGPLAATLLDSFVSEAVTYMSEAVAYGALTPSDDEPARARYLTYAGFGAMVLFARYEASDPANIEVLTREFVERYGTVTAELYAKPLFTDPEFYATYVAARTRQEES